MRFPNPFFALALAALLLTGGALQAQHEVTARVIDPGFAEHHTPAEPRAALLWLKPLSPTAGPGLVWTPQASYRLLQKNKMFSPHLLVVPVGAAVAFPNADPFFHNVFSLFDGKRFDLGLYEAGRSRDVRFEREGISYIFCNIHPEMGAIVIALTTPLWAALQTNGTFHITAVPEGVYEVHLWLEGENDGTLRQWTHTVSVHGQDAIDAGTFLATPMQRMPHLDKFNHPYKSDPAAY